MNPVRKYIYAQSNIKMHVKVYHKTGNQLWWQVYNQLWIQSQRIPNHQFFIRNKK